MLYMNPGGTRTLEVGESEAVKRQLLEQQGWRAVESFIPPAPEETAPDTYIAESVSTPGSSEAAQEVEDGFAPLTKAGKKRARTGGA